MVKLSIKVMIASGDGRAGMQILPGNSGIWRRCRDQGGVSMR
jgi:hypothetical protein